MVSTNNANGKTATTDSGLKICSNVNRPGKTCRGRPTMQPASEFKARNRETKTCRACREYEREKKRQQRSKWQTRLAGQDHWPLPPGRKIGYLDDRKAALICTTCPLPECVYMPAGPEISECPLPVKFRY